MSDAGTRFHVQLEDPASGETLGLMLAESGGGVDRLAQLANPYAAKVGGGDMQLSDLSDLSVYSQTEWTGGRGQESFFEQDEDRYFDSKGIETRIKGQITLGPLPQQAAVEQTGGASATAASYEPTSTAGYAVGYTGKIIQEVGSDSHWFGSTNYDEAQRVYLTAGMKVTTMEVKIYKNGACTADCRVSLYSDAGGIPGSSLAYADIANASIGVHTMAWEIATLASSYEIATAGYYWIVCSGATTDGSGFRWQSSGSNPYANGYRAEQEGSSTWTKSLTEDYCFRIGQEKKYRGQSFDDPGDGISCTHVFLRLRKTGTLAQDYNVKLYDDSSGPDSELKTIAIGDSDLETSFGEIKITWASAQTLTGSATYWVTVEPGATADEEGSLIEWAGDGTASYASGACMDKSGAESWAADATTDMWFRVNDGAVAEGGDMTVNPIRFNDKWYMAGGDTVYKWNAATPRWDIGDAQSAETVTSLAVFGSKLYAARGANNMRECNTSDSWSDVNWGGAVQAQIIFTYNRFLFYTDAGNLNQIYYSADASTWYGPYDICPSDWGATALAGWRGANDLWIGTEVGLYRNLLSFADQVLDFSALENDDNCKGLTYWAKTADLYIPVLYGLYRWNGGTNVPIGPDQGTGLPSARTGKILNMWGTVNWLYAALDGGTSNTSSLLATDGMGAWHEISRAEVAGARIRAVGYETISSPARLWFSEGDKIKFLELPDFSDNPYGFSTAAYAAEGELITSWWGTELLQVTKDFRYVEVHAEDCAAAQTIRVSYEVDRSGQWTLLDTINDGRTMHRLLFPISAMAAKTIGSSSTSTTIELATGSTTGDLGVDDWVIINEEIRQISSITDSNTFVLSVALSDAPASGDYVKGSRCAGVEIRLKIELATTAATASPKLLSVGLFCQANVLDRWTINLGVLVQDEMTMLNGETYPLDSASLVAALEGWVNKQTAFTLHDIWGIDRTVKISNASNSGIRRVNAEQNQVPARYSGLYRLALTEVDVG